MNRRCCLVVLATLATGGACSGDPGWTESFDAGEVGWFMNVWGTSATAMYAAGGAPDAGVLMHFDGDAWAPVELGIDVPLLTWIHGFGPNDITVVGNGGTVIHYNGDSWELQGTPTDEDLWGVWGATPDELWAVGGRGREEGQQTLLAYDGDSWETVDVPPLERANVFAFFKVFGTSRDNVYVVGQRGVVLHYDGDEWVEELVGASADLIAVWGPDPDRIVAVGGRGSGIVSVYDGSEWRTESLAPLGGLNGVWLDSPDTAQIVGVTGTLATLDLETFEVEQTFADTTLDFHATFSPDGQRQYAVGGNLFAVEGPYRGIAYERTIEE